MSLLIAVDDDGDTLLSVSFSSSSSSHQLSKSPHHLKSRTYLLIRLTTIPAKMGPPTPSMVFYLSLIHI